MRDIDKLLDVFHDFGIGYHIHLNKDGSEVVHLKEGRDKIDGFSYFYADFMFDESGTFGQVWIGE